MVTVEPRRVALLVAVLGSVVILIILVATPAGVLSVPAAAQLILSVVLVAAVAYIAMAVRRADGKTLRIDAQVKKVDSRLRDIETSTGAGFRGLSELVDSVDGASREARAEDRVELTSLRSQLGDLLARIGGLEKDLAGLALRAEEIGTTAKETGPMILTSLGEDRAERAAMARRIDAIASDMTFLRAKIEQLGSAPRQGGGTHG